MIQSLLECAYFAACQDALGYSEVINSQKVKLSQTTWVKSLCCFCSNSQIVKLQKNKSMPSTDSLKKGSPVHVVPACAGSTPPIYCRDLSSRLLQVGTNTHILNSNLFTLQHAAYAREANKNRKMLVKSRITTVRKSLHVILKWMLLGGKQVLMNIEF
jgi:hypothetical protein